MFETYTKDDTNMLKQIYGCSKRETIFKKSVQKDGCPTFKFRLKNVVFDNRDEIKMRKFRITRKREFQKGLSFNHPMNM